jgi:hypothetical protein
MGARHGVRTRLFAEDRALSPEQHIDAVSADAALFAPSVSALDDAFAVAWIASATDGIAARAIRITEDGAASALSSIEATSGRVLYSPRAVSLWGGASLFACVEGATSPSPRWVASEGAPPELSALDDADADAVRNVATDAHRVALVWPTQHERALRALVLPRR